MKSWGSGLRGSKRKYKVRARRGFAKKILTEEEVAFKASIKTSRDAAREAEGPRQGVEGNARELERRKLLT